MARHDDRFLAWVWQGKGDRGETNTLGIGLCRGSPRRGLHRLGHGRAIREGRRTPSPTSSPDAPGATPAADTRRLDSVAVLGHSGATGTQSDPDDPDRNATENSWATGTNPRVRSIYQRLLSTHPHLRGHHYNQAVNGATV